MSVTSKSAVHWSFWIIGGAALAWNAMGCLNFIVQMNPDSHTGYPVTARAIIEGRPLWATAGFAAGVFFGALGCLLLLLRKSSAACLLLVSLLGVLVTMAHTLAVARASGGGFAPIDVTMMIVMPVVVAALLVVYSRYAKRRQWLD